MTDDAGQPADPRDFAPEWNGERGLYGSPEHEAMLLEQERNDVPDERPDQPWTPCGCTARAYGGDCRHTVDPED